MSVDIIFNHNVNICMKGGDEKDKIFQWKF